MRLFSTREARHFCENHRPGPTELVLSALPLDRRKRIVEGTAEFDTLRSALLENAERNLFFAASHYRRALDLLIPSSVHWAHVTLYYGAWYAANGILNMLGGAVLKGNRIVEVATSRPGFQALRLDRNDSTLDGSHQKFWDVFYRAVLPLKQLVAPEHAVGLTPVSSDPSWLSLQRNAINYDTHHGFSAARHFLTSFQSEKFPTSLPGPLATQYRILEALVELAYNLAHSVSLETAALGGLDTQPALRQVVNDTVYGATPPDLVSRTKVASLTGTTGST